MKRNEAMEQYIKKSALVAEIERIKEMYCYDTKTNASFVAEAVINSINNAINTIEAKDVDLEKELESWRHNHFHGRRDKEASGEYLERVSQLDFAKHFFELGLKAKTK